MFVYERDEHDFDHIISRIKGVYVGAVYKSLDGLMDNELHAMQLKTKGTE